MPAPAGRSARFFGAGGGARAGGGRGPGDRSDRAGSGDGDGSVGMPAPTGRSAHFFGTWWMTRIFGIALAALAMAAPLVAQTPGVTRANGGIMIDFQGTDMRLAVA